MNTLPSLEKAGAYLNVHLTHTGPGGQATPVGPFITISRESGCGGSVLAQALAARLPRGDEGRPWTVYSANLIEEMLKSNHLPPNLARFLPEDRISEIDASTGELVGLHPNLWSLVQKTNELIRHLARQGCAILLGRGAAFATAGIEHGLHVRLVAPAAERARYTSRRLAMDASTAATFNSRRDGARERYVRATFNADINDPYAYDLVINSARMPTDAIIETIAGFVRIHRRPAAAAAN